MEILIDLGIGEDDDIIPLPNINSAIMKKVKILFSFFFENK